MNKRSIAMTFAGAALVAAGLAGCGSSSSESASHSMSHPSTSTTASSTPMTMSTATPGTPASGPHNDADVSFATDMIPHHSQAIAMAEMALTKATNGQVKALAADIKAAQDPEMTKMAGWLQGWGKPVPANWMSGMDHSSMGSMTGMMSDDDMTKLDSTSGAAFDRMWVQMMVEHHQGAITMAKTELTSGQNSEAKALAQSIVTSQSKEVAQLQALLGQLPTA